MPTLACQPSAVAAPDLAYSTLSHLRDEAAAQLERAPQLPLPGRGQTRARWRALAQIAATDLCVVKVLEAHYDAQAILADLGEQAPASGELWAVWAAEPPGLALEFEAADAVQGTLVGTKAWCSGASLVTHALITARQGQARVLCRMPLDDRRTRYDDSRWQAVGMSRITSGTLQIDGAPAQRVGAPGQYLDRPGFWHGGAGIAACWYGGAVAIAERLRGDRRAASQPHLAAHLGKIDVALSQSQALLIQTAALIDSAPDQAHRTAVTRLRSSVESTCRQVVDRVGRALGAGPLCHEGDHAQRCADLLTFIRQHHAEQDLQGLGQAVASLEQCPWSL